MGRKPKDTTNKPAKEPAKNQRLTNIDLYKHLSNAEIRKLTKLSVKYGVEEERLIAVAIQGLLDGRIEIATKNEIYLKPVE